VTKIYRALVDGFIAQEVIERLHAGAGLARTRGEVIRAGRPFMKIVRRSGERTLLEITIREGRDPELRKVLAKLGHKVRELTRVSFGPLDLEGVGTGRYRALSEREVRMLKKIGREADEGGESRNLKETRMMRDNQK
jgi:23S rRNA pseudouridine2605 synthase